MSRHVAYVEAKGLPTPSRIQRQRRIIRGLSERYRSLSESAGGAPVGWLRPSAGFPFSRRTSPEDALAKLVAVLDEVDPDWRSFVHVWDGFYGRL